MTRCYEYYCLPVKCEDITKTSKWRIETYVDFMVSKGVKFNKTPEDKKLFTEMVTNFGSERAYCSPREYVPERECLPGEPTQLRLFNTWFFTEALHGEPEYEWGYNTGHITENLLYYYTEPNDLVLDPMAGSGTTLDACERMERRVEAYDISPKRDTIRENDIEKGLPAGDPVQLVFLDPPFFNLMKDWGFWKYSHFERVVKAGIDASISRLKEGGYLALIMKNMCEAKDNPKRPMIADCYNWLQEREELVFENMILCPLSTQRSGTDKAKENKELLNNARVVWVFKKV